MSVAMLEQIPVRRRNALFQEIASLVNEAGAIDRALEYIDEGWSIDETLEAIVERIDEEIKVTRKCRRLAKILRMDRLDNADGADDAA